jgi:hypothetical protein
VAHIAGYAWVIRSISGFGLARYALAAAVASRLVAKVDGRITWHEVSSEVGHLDVNLCWPYKAGR